MIRNAFNFIFCVVSLVVLNLHITAVAQTKTVTTPLPIDPLKDVQKVYLGFFQVKRPAYAKCLCEELTYFLTKEGFSVVPIQKDADATLLGSFQLGSFQILRIPFPLMSRAKVVLIDQNYKQLWRYETETSDASASKSGTFSARARGRRTCGFERWRAIYIAEALKKAKAMANNQ